MSYGFDFVVRVIELIAWGLDPEGVGHDSLI